MTLLATGLLLAGGCGESDTPLSPGQIVGTLTEQLEAATITFFFSPGDSVDSQWQQQYNDWLSAELGIVLPQKLRYYKYRDNGQMMSITGRECCFAEAETFSIHTIWQRDNHEVVHVYVRQVAAPPSIFNEGIAVAFQTDPVAGVLYPRWNGTHLHSLAQGFRRQGRLIPLDDLIVSNDFWDHSDSITYPESGSFVYFLIEEHGQAKMMELIRSLDVGASKGETRSRFQAIFGFGLDEAERRWHGMLDAWAGP